MIVLDTNVISEPLRSRPDARVISWLDGQALETLYLTTITVAEIRYGIASLPDGQRKQTLAERIEGEVLPHFAGRILCFDEPATRAYAELRSVARSHGVAIGDYDALIASIAADRGFAVASRDVSPFRALGVAVFNPFETA